MAADARQGAKPSARSLIRRLLEGPILRWVVRKALANHPCCETRPTERAFCQHRASPSPAPQALALDLTCREEEARGRREGQICIAPRCRSCAAASQVQEKPRMSRSQCDLRRSLATPSKSDKPTPSADPAGERERRTQNHSRTKSPVLGPPALHTPLRPDRRPRLRRRCGRRPLCRSARAIPRIRANKKHKLRRQRAATEASNMCHDEGACHYTMHVRRTTQQR